MFLLPEHNVNDGFYRG